MAHESGPLDAASLVRSAALADAGERKRAVYVAFLVLGAAGALLSFSVNLARGTPDLSVAVVTVVAVAVLSALAAVVRARRLPLVAFEWLVLATASVLLLAALVYALQVVPAGVGAPVGVLSTLYWVPIVFTFAFIAFDARTATYVSIALALATLALALPAGLARSSVGLVDEAFVVVQAFGAYLVIIAGLRFFTDLHGPAPTHEAGARSLDELAHTDALTGLANRRQAEALMGRELLRAERYGRSFSVLMLDLDRFERLNAKFGRRAGDDVISDVARRLTGLVRGSDTVCRWGGEEFVVLAPETDVADAVHLAEAIRDHLARHALGNGHRLTVSAGVAAFRRGDRAPDLIARADAALYLAKRSGRNLVRQQIVSPD
jgi:diguanylate cyclase